MQIPSSGKQHNRHVEIRGFEAIQWTINVVCYASPLARLSGIISNKLLTLESLSQELLVEDLTLRKPCLLMKIDEYREDTKTNVKTTCFGGKTQEQSGNVS